ncbi:MAG: hypothetical protein GX369_03625 [Euryarchaeota archaeon]|nr:hypothetical protein [Euryarchaeota archaeon]
MRRRGMLVLLVSAIVLGVMFVLSVFKGDSYAYSTLLVSILLLIIPASCIKNNVIVLPWPILVSIGLSLSLHGLGVLTSLYQTSWWDIITHFVSGVTVASLAAILLIVTIVSSDKIMVPVSWIPFLLFVTVLAMEGIWEIMEFTFDNIIGTGMQHGLNDTMKDIAVNALSGIVAGVGFAYYISKASLDDLVESLRVERVVEWARNKFDDHYSF